MKCINEQVQPSLVLSFLRIWLNPILVLFNAIESRGIRYIYHSFCCYSIKDDCDRIVIDCDNLVIIVIVMDKIEASCLDYMLGSLLYEPCKLRHPHSHLDPLHIHYTAIYTATYIHSTDPYTVSTYIHVSAYDFAQTWVLCVCERLSTTSLSVNVSAPPSLSLGTRTQRLMQSQNTMT